MNGPFLKWNAHPWMYKSRNCFSFGCFIRHFTRFFCFQTKTSIVCAAHFPFCSNIKTPFEGFHMNLFICHFLLYNTFQMNDITRKWGQIYSSKFRNFGCDHLWMFLSQNNLFTFSPFFNWFIFCPFFWNAQSFSTILYRFIINVTCTQGNSWRNTLPK